NEGFKTPLHCAAQNGHLDVVKLLLDHKADVNAESTIDGTPLNIVFDNEHLRVNQPESELTTLVELLLSYGADVNATNNYGWTPLHAAARGFLKTAEMLIAHGANVNAK